MFIQPDFPKDAFDLISSKDNLKVLKYLKSRGANGTILSILLKDHFSVIVQIKELFRKARNPEAVYSRGASKLITNHYTAAINSLEKLSRNVDMVIPEDIESDIVDWKAYRASHIRNWRSSFQKDIDTLKNHMDVLTHKTFMNVSIHPEPTTIKQMLRFQIYALYKYLDKFRCELHMKDIHCFLVELFQNLYKNTMYEGIVTKLNIETLKKNYIDNAEQHTSRRMIKRIDEHINQICKTSLPVKNTLKK
ncbi:MAG: hypothetical protein GXY72_00605 [Deltaproteobacteria bacterium]|nr:hypothetical protein [Deltaproteobacteria bacterium]